MAVSGYITNEKGEVLLVRNVHRRNLGVTSEKSRRKPEQTAINAAVRYNTHFYFSLYLLNDSKKAIKND